MEGNIDRRKLLLNAGDERQRQFKEGLDRKPERDLMIPKLLLSRKQEM